jgi:hypothetical protein
MGQKTVAVVGIGFAPKRNTNRKQPKTNAINDVSRDIERKENINSRTELIDAAEANPTDPIEMAGTIQIGETATKAVVGIGFAPKKS